MRPNPAAQEALSYFARGMCFTIDDEFWDRSKTATNDQERQVLDQALTWLGTGCKTKMPDAAGLVSVYRYAMRRLPREEVLAGFFYCDWATVFWATEWLAEQAGVPEVERWPTAGRLPWPMSATKRRVRVFGGDIKLDHVVGMLRATPHPIYEVQWLPLVSHLQVIRVNEEALADQEPEGCLDWPVIVSNDQLRRIPLIGWRRIEKARTEGATHVPACLLTSEETRLACNRPKAKSASLDLYEPNGCEGIQADGRTDE